MNKKEQPPRVDGDASELPGAILIRPERNPNMIYDPETGRVTDTETGESFGSRQEMRSGGIYTAGIKAADGSPIYEYELKYGNPRNPDGSVKRVVWQVFWARRGDWLERFRGQSTKEVKAFELAQAEAQSDSLERLAQFLRAKNEGIYQAHGQPVEGEVVIVDRRMDDTRGERVW